MSAPEPLDALVIGAGPAGLMAADALACAGRRVTIAEAMPSPARKFLMAGKSGLNLTKDDPPDTFLRAYGDAAGWLAPMLAQFGPEAVQNWSQSLGQEVFTGSSGRVFPVAMKASPLLRAWLARLDGLDVTLRRRWRWTGWGRPDCGGPDCGGPGCGGQAEVAFDTPQGARTLAPRVTVLACGGASWARLGSDGAWAQWLGPITPFAPANMGFRTAWSPHMERFAGQPVKPVRLSAGARSLRGEFVITHDGIEGGGIYGLSRDLRAGAPLLIDLAPDLPLDEIRRRLSRPRGKTSLSNHLRKTLGLTPVKLALLRETAHPLPDDPSALIKALPLPLCGPAPLDRAISTAGGLSRSGFDDALMLTDRPGTFAAGEMLDWEAPTGGYLLTACLATGLWAGQAAARWTG